MNKRILEPQKVVVIILVELSIELKLGMLAEEYIISFTKKGELPNQEQTLPSCSG